MLIALSSTFIVLSIILLVSFLWERKKCLRIQKRLFRESRKLDRTNHITSAILKNVHAYILLIDNDFKVLKTNYLSLIHIYVRPIPPKALSLQSKLNLSEYRLKEANHQSNKDHVPIDLRLLRATHF